MSTTTTMNLLKERVSTISMAGASTFALLMAILAGSSCSFIKMNAIDGDVLVQMDGDELDIEQVALGVSCPSDIFSPTDDWLWRMSQVFFGINVAMGTITTVGAWGLASVVHPTNKRWRNLSICSALTSLCAVPVFLIFECKPCTEFQFQQTCTYSTGSTLQIISTLIWLIGVAITQYMDPPTYGEEPRKIDNEIEPNPTMQTDVEQGSSPRSAGIPDTLAVTIGEEKKEDDFQPAEFESFAGAFNAFSEQKKETKSPTRDSNSKGDQITVLPENETNTAVSRYPAYQEEPLQEQTAFQSKMELDMKQAESEGEKAQPLPNFANFDDFDDLPPAPPVTNDVINKSSKSSFKLKITPIAHQKKIVSRLSTFANRFKIERPSFGRNRSQAYNHMVEDEMSSKGSISYNPSAMHGDTMSVRSQVPSEESSVLTKTHSVIAHEKLLLDDWNALHAVTNAVQLKQQEQHSKPKGANNFQNFSKEAKKEHQQLDEWNALHLATTAGARMGLIEGMSGTEDPYEVASYHSDPEPVIYSSDEEEEDDLMLSRPNHIPSSIIPDDNSTISSHSSTSVNRKQSKSRRSFRSKHHNRSDLLSVSLLSLTIDEETVEDILEETSEEEMHNPYSFVRTTSAPEPRKPGIGIEVSLSSRARRPLADGDGDAVSIKTAQPTIRGNFGKKQTWKDPLDLGLATPSKKDPLDLGMAASPSTDSLDLLMAASPYNDPLCLGMSPIPYKDSLGRGMVVSPYKHPQASSPYNNPLLFSNENDIADDQTAPRENAIDRNGHRGAQSDQDPESSPEKLRRNLSTDEYNAGIKLSSPMIARRLKAMQQEAQKDASSSDDSNYGKRERTRALRIARMKQQSLNTSNFTDATNLNTSYESKHSNSTWGSPTKQNTLLSYKEEKEDDISELAGTRLITPDTKSPHQSVSFKRDSTFDDDAQNVDDDSVKIAMQKTSSSCLITPNSNSPGQSFSFKKDSTFDNDEQNVDDDSVEVVMQKTSSNSNEEGFLPSSILVQGPNTGIQKSNLSKGIGEKPIFVETSPKVDDISIVTPHCDIKDSDSDEDRLSVDYIKAGATKVRERILQKFSFSERSQTSSRSQASLSNASTDNSAKYGSHIMDRIHLQLIEVRRPQGAEYGEEEASL